MRRLQPFCVALVFVCAPATVSAWWVKGHETIAQASASILPEDVPPFFRAGAKTIAHFSGEPDRWKNKDATFLRVGETPEHFIDLENFQGNAIPEDRYKAAALLTRLGEQPDKTGMLPFAIMEYFDRLTCAFYELRQEPENEVVRLKCLMYAGLLSHYTGDLSMPLHTTIDYDGRKGPAGQLVQKGIHAKIDAFPERFGLTAEEMSRDLKPAEIGDVWKHVIQAIHESHTHVGHCYELDSAGAFEKPTEQSRAFILGRCHAGAQLTADLYYTAWKRSVRFRPPY